MTKPEKPLPQIRDTDPDVDNGAFSSMTTDDIMSWLLGIGCIREIDPRMKTSRTPKEQREVALKNLRLALWDMQRFDYLFPGKEYSLTPKFKVSRLDSWPKWKDPHPEVRADGMGLMKFDVYKDSERMKSYVMTAFHLLAFTQLEMAGNDFAKPPTGRAGNWIGVKKMMCHASLHITGEGGRKTPFVTYVHKDHVLIMEFLDVKRVSWPEPGPKFLKQLQESQEVKFSVDPGAPLVPMLETPVVPLVAVRYTYAEGCPEGGSHFMLHLENRLREILPPNISDANLRSEIEKHLRAGEEMPAEHIRTFARLLSYNSELVDGEWVREVQSHWNVSAEVQKETRVSFFVPCLRPRFRAVEEIETGKKPGLYSQCGECGKNTAQHMCGSCKAICYCDAKCAKAHWPTHKSVCKISKKISTNPSSLPPDTLYIPVRAYIHWVVDFGFASEQESVKLGGPPVDENPRSEYAPAERFICCALLANAGSGDWDPFQSKVVWDDQGAGTAFLYDRRRSVIVRFGPQEPVKAARFGVVIPFHESGYRQFAEVVRKRGVQGQLMYLWVRRVGDCIEIDLNTLESVQPVKYRILSNIWHWNVMLRAKA